MMKLRIFIAIFLCVMSVCSWAQIGGEYNPENPSDPGAPVQKYSLTLTATPQDGGSFNFSNERVAAGSVNSLYAYASSDFVFKCWMIGDSVLSRSQSLEFVMPSHPVEIVGVFEYDPTSPANPNVNYWNPKDGTLVLDDFRPGRLIDAANTVLGNGNREDVSMITVVGIIDTYDFGISNYFENCKKLDLSRVTGATEVPSYAFDNTNLESVYLPGTIEKIGYCAFYGCSNLSSLTLYSHTPPELEGSVFEGVPEGLVVYVPAAVIPLYQEAAGWKDFNLLPIKEDICNITVAFPTDANLTDFTDMRLELCNMKNGQRIHLVVTDRMQYTFSNVIRNTSWNIALRNERGDVFGRIENVEVKDEDVSVIFSSLSRPQSVALVVQSPDGRDITRQTQITWTDSDGGYLAQGGSLAGLPAGYKVTFSVALSQDLAMQYVSPQSEVYELRDGANIITCILEPIKQVEITGKVTDSSTGLALSGATVSASQTFAGKYTRTLNTRTDNKGMFALSIAKVPTSMAFASADYVSATMACDSLLTCDSAVSLPDVSLKPITGATVAVGFTYTDVNGNSRDWYNDYQNVDFELFNLTKDKAIAQYNVQYPKIVLMDDVEDGDKLRLIASSRNHAFLPVESVVKVVDQTAEATFDILELGQIQASFAKTGNASVVGSLYDAEGKLIKTYRYTNASLSIPDIVDGKYSLVSMGSSHLFNSIYDLAQLPQTGLTEGVDYVVNQLEVKSGSVSKIDIEEVPLLKESKLYYTGDNTSFTVNKPSIVAGNYLTLTGHIDFKPSYASGVSNVQMIVDLPESCEFVDNSVMVGNNTSTYAVNGNRITIPMECYTDRVRFCIIPIAGGEYAPSAFAQFDLNGETITQPIGSANYTIKNLSISVPSTVAKTTIPVSGIAIGKSDIEIYDGSVLIGQTTSLANGIWYTTCELNNPYNLSEHNIFATVKTANGLEIISEVKECQYDKNAIEAKTVTMTFYNGWLHRNVDVVFDLQNKTVDNSSYMFYTGTDISFIADLTNNDTTVVNNVTIRVYTDKKNWRNIEAAYDENKDRWVAVAHFESNELPIGVEVDFSEVSKEREEDREYLTSLLAQTDNTIENTTALLDFIRGILTNETDSGLAGIYDELFSVLSAGISDVDEFEKLLGMVMDTTDDSDDINDEVLDNLISNFYDEEDLLEQNYLTCLDSISESYYIYKELADFIPDTFYSAEIENDNYKGLYKMEPIIDIDEAQLIQNGYTVCPMTDGSCIYIKFSENDMSFIDLKTKIKYSLELDSEVEATNSIAKKKSFYENFALCLSIIKDGINSLKGFSNNSGNVISIGKEVNDILSVIKDGASCFYFTYRGELLKFLKEVHAKDLAEVESKISENKTLSKQINSKINKRVKRIRELLKEQKIIEENRTILSELISSNISEDEKLFYQKEYDKLGNQLTENKENVKAAEKRVEEFLKDERKINERIGKLNKQKLAKIEGFNNVMSTFWKLPPTLTKGVGKTIRILGKLAGPFGVLIEAACLFEDLNDGIKEIDEWVELYGRALGYFPCENDSMKLRRICDDIYSESQKVIGHVNGIIIAESGALSLDLHAVSFSYFNIYAWLISGALNGYGEIGKNLILGNYINKRGEYYNKLSELNCKKDFCPKCGHNPCICKPPYPIIEPIYDPSGFVYEGVTSNRLEGVTATCFYKEEVEDMYGDLHEEIVKWDAEEYAQKNPLFTDENGMYAWDVPQGLWQVKFEKDGYETTQSEWLPVPPPQLEVNIAMKQNRQPEVRTARAYGDAVEVEFDKYMMPESLTAENISVMQNGKRVDGSIELLNEEAAAEGSTETFASKARFNATQPFEAEEITLLVNNRVKSYAGVRMQDAFQQTFTVEQEIRRIASDSVTVVGYGEQKSIYVSVLPVVASKGKTICVKTSSPMILSVDTEQAVVDDNGMAEILVSGQLPGTAALTFAVEGTDKTAVTIVNVKQVVDGTVANPKVSIASGTIVDKGTEIELSCDTEGAIIYYTLDGSCPCDPTDARKVYDGTPIVITHDTTIKAMAVAEGMYDSDVVEFNYYVDETGISDASIDELIEVYPLPVREKLNVRAGGKMIRKVVVTSVNGMLVTKTSKEATEITLDMSNVPNGIYIVNISTDEGGFSRKIYKVR